MSSSAARSCNEDGTESDAAAMKSKKMKVMQESDETQESRRKTRNDLDLAKKELINNRVNLKDYSSDALTAAMQSSSQLFKKVKYAREMVKDTDNLKMLSGFGLQQTTQMESTPFRGRSSDIIDALRQKMHPGTCARDDFNWTRFGVKVGPLMRTVPAITFMNGPLGRELKLRKTRTVKHKYDDDAAAVVPEECVPDKDTDETEKRISTLHTVLAEWHKANPDRPAVDFALLVINPASFTQTVENIFDLSYDIKEGAAAVTVDRELGTLMVRQIVDGGGEEDANEESPTDITFSNNQSVLAMSVEDFHDMIELYDLKGKDPLIPARSEADGYDDPLTQPEATD